MAVLVGGCTPTAAPPPPAALSPTARLLAPTATPPPPTATPSRPAATVVPKLTNVKTFHAEVAFETYETEETVQLQLGRLPGIISVNVTQLDVTVQYDPARLSEDELLRTLRDNPEVRIKDDSRAGR